MDIPKCKICDKGMIVVKTAMGYSYQCPNYYKCGQMDNKLYREINKTK